MGKIRTRVVGLEEVEEEQKKQQKQRAAAKKVAAGKTEKETSLEEETKKTAKEEKKAKKASSKAMQELKEVEKKEEMESAESTQSIEQTRTELVRPTSQKSKPKKKGQPAKGKKHKAAEKSIDNNKVYSVVEAVSILKKVKYAGFDESVELHLNVLETGLKGEIELPHATGKSVRVAIVDDALIEKLEKGVMDFDVLITHPSFMPKLAKFARTLGPKGLMPNPKAGTISANPEEVAKKFDKGLLKWKTEPKFPIVHQMIGKISHDEKALVENAQAFLNSVGTGKIKAAYIKTTMSPSLKVIVG